MDEAEGGGANGDSAEVSLEKGDFDSDFEKPVIQLKLDMEEVGFTGIKIWQQPIALGVDGDGDLEKEAEMGRPPPENLGPKAKISRIGSDEAERPEGAQDSSLEP